MLHYVLSSYFCFLYPHLILILSIPVGGRSCIIHILEKSDSMANNMLNFKILHWFVLRITL